MSCPTKAASLELTHQNYSLGTEQLVASTWNRLPLATYLEPSHCFRPLFTPHYASPRDDSASLKQRIRMPFSCTFPVQVAKKALLSTGSALRGLKMHKISVKKPIYGFHEKCRFLVPDTFSSPFPNHICLIIRHTFNPQTLMPHALYALFRYPLPTLPQPRTTHPTKLRIPKFGRNQLKNIQIFGNDLQGLHISYQ